MTWTKLGDEFFPEIGDLSDAAALLHIKALGWSNWRLLDLVIRRHDLKKFAFIESKPVAEAIDELIETGWWQLIDDDTYWIGCRFSEWQRDRVQVEHLRDRKARDQRRKRRHDLDDHSLCISGRCPALSPGDRSGDSPTEGRGDPGRVGSGTGKPNPSLEEKREGVRPLHGQRCQQCERVSGFSLIGGRCRKCHDEWSRDAS